MAAKKKSGATAKKNGGRRISKTRSVRLGNRSYGRGDEDELLEQITPERAEQLVERGVLEGDWSKAKGRYQERANELADARVARTPVGRALGLGGRTANAASVGVKKQRARPVEPDEDEEELEEEEVGDDEPNLAEMTGELTLQEHGGGWVGFTDAEGTELATGDGSPYRVQGKEAAEKELEKLNKKIKK